MSGCGSKVREKSGCDSKVREKSGCDSKVREKSGCDSKVREKMLVRERGNVNGECKSVGERKGRGSDRKGSGRCGND